jgi:hypothetical protein
MLRGELQQAHTVGLGHIVDELHDEHGLAHAGTAKEPNLASTLVGGQKVHHLQGCPSVVSIPLLKLIGAFYLGHLLGKPACHGMKARSAMRAAHLDACDKNLLLCALVHKWGRFSVDCKVVLRVCKIHTLVRKACTCAHASPDAGIARPMRLTICNRMYRYTAEKEVRTH